MDLRSGETKAITSGDALLPRWALLLKRNLFTSGWLLLSGRLKPGCFKRAEKSLLTPQRLISCGKHFVDGRFLEEHPISCFYLHYFVAPMAATKPKITLQSRKKMEYSRVCLNGEWKTNLWAPQQMFTSPLSHPNSLLQTTLLMQTKS